LRQDDFRKSSFSVKLGKINHLAALSLIFST
jgi:hypothetical protein